MCLGVDVERWKSSTVLSPVCAQLPVCSPGAQLFPQSRSWAEGSAALAETLFPSLYFRRFAFSVLSLFLFTGFFPFPLFKILLFCCGVFPLLSPSLLSCIFLNFSSIFLFFSLPEAPGAAPQLGPLWLVAKDLLLIPRSSDCSRAGVCSQVWGLGLSVTVFYGIKVVWHSWVW